MCVMESRFRTIVMECVEYFKHFDNVLLNFVYKYAINLLVRTSRSILGLQEWTFEFIFDVIIFYMN